MINIKLTSTQQNIVKTRGRNVLVSAGAGTGKTRVLVERFLDHILEDKVPMTEILALTFTDKAANEMKVRILERLKELGLHGERRDLEKAYISTIHAFASRVLKEHPVEAAVSPDFTVIEGDEAMLLEEKVLDEILESMAVDGSPVFEWMKQAGEETLRRGIRKIFQTARLAGQSAAEYFSAHPVLTKNPAGPAEEIEELFIRLNEKDLAAGWKVWGEKKDFTWQDVKAYKAWRSQFSRKRKPEIWLEVRDRTQAFLEFKLEGMLGPWRDVIEDLVKQFETLYTHAKREKGVLDFDDLQIRVLRLFESENPAAKKLLTHYRRHFKYIMVDEFQDTSPLQVKLIELLSNGNNLFFVGDYKQSIYGFRGTSPELFLSRVREYTPAADVKKTQEQKGRQTGGISFSLNESFRMTPSLAQFINPLFSALWAESGFRYEAIESRREETQAGPVELLLVPKEEGRNTDQGRIREAEMMAGRILELREEGFAYKDMAVLFSAMTSGGIYEYALKRAGIPYYVVKGRWFYHQPEIRDMISMLKCLENPLADIPLAAVLRSPFFHATDDTLFWLAHFAKSKDKEVPLFWALKHTDVIQNIPEPEKRKLRGFWVLFHRLLEMKDQKPLAEILEWILSETQYELSALSDPAGVRRFANMKKFVQIAREYENRSRISLGDFMRLIEHFESNEIKESEAQVDLEDSSDAVRLMTIHTAKGLEFKICFVADISRRQNRPESKVFVADTENGCSFCLRGEVDSERKDFASSYKIIREAERRRERDEQKRLFYVALTRAKSKLILCGMKEPEDDEEESPGKEKTLADLNCWMDWVWYLRDELPLVVKEKIEFRTAGNFRKRPVEQKNFQPLLDALEPKPLEELIPDKKIREAAREKGEAVLIRIQEMALSPSRVINLPVSAFAAYAKNPEEYIRVYEAGYRISAEPETASAKEESPDFAEDHSREEKAGAFPEEGEEISAADFGTALHAVLEQMDFKHPERIFEKNWQPFFYGMGDSKIKEAQKILRSLLEGDVFKRLAKADTVCRELPFVLNERHGAIYGVMDVLFQDAGGGWCILDYKTAEGSEKKLKASGYEMQIKIYALAARKILGVCPRSGVIYFLKNQWVSEVKLDDGILDAFEEELRRIQTDILNLSHEILARAESE